APRASRGRPARKARQSIDQSDGIGSIDDLSTAVFPAARDAAVVVPMARICRAPHAHIARAPRRTGNGCRLLFPRAKPTQVFLKIRVRLRPPFPNSGSTAFVARPPATASNLARRGYHCQESASEANTTPSEPCPDRTPASRGGWRSHGDTPAAAP